MNNEFNIFVKIVLLASTPIPESFPLVEAPLKFLLIWHQTAKVYFLKYLQNPQILLQQKIFTKKKKKKKATQSRSVEYRC